MKFMISLTCSVLIATLLIGVLPVDGEEAIYDNVIRFHVLANSDSEEDQILKLQVRDEVLGTVRTWLKDCQNVEDSKRVLEPRLDEIRSLAEACILEKGYPYSCEVTADIRSLSDAGLRDLPIPRRRLLFAPYSHRRGERTQLVVRPLSSAVSCGCQ